MYALCVWIAARRGRIAALENGRKEEEEESVISEGRERIRLTM